MEPLAEIAQLELLCLIATIGIDAVLRAGLELRESRLDLDRAAELTFDPCIRETPGCV